MQMSDYLEAATVDHLLRGQAWAPPAGLWLGLFSSASTDAAPGAEPVGEGGYARQPVSLAAPVAGVASSVAAVAFPLMPDGTWTHAGLFDAAVGGNMLVHGPLVASKITMAGQALGIDAGDVTVAFTPESAATVAFRDLILDRMLRGEAWAGTAGVEAALYETATDTAGGGTEVLGGSYARQPVTLLVTAPGTAINDDTVTFPGLPATTVTHAALHHAGDGTMWLQSPLATAVPVGAGDALMWNEGDVTVRVR